MEIFNLTEVSGRLDTELLNELLVASVAEGFRHLVRLVEDYTNGTNRFDLEGEALFLYGSGDRVIGVCGLNRDPYHGPAVGRVRRLYVLPEFRGQGLGKKLIQAVISRAKEHYRVLVLKTDNIHTGVFYKTLGFIDDHKDTKMSHYLLLN